MLKLPRCPMRPSPIFIICVFEITVHTVRFRKIYRIIYNRKYPTRFLKERETADHQRDREGGQASASVSRQLQTREKENERESWRVVGEKN